MQFLGASFLILSEQIRTGFEHLPYFGGHHKAAQVALLFYIHRYQNFDHRVLPSPE